MEDKPPRAISAFWVPFFSEKGTEVQGQRPWSLTAVSEMLQAKEAQEWVNFDVVKKRANPRRGFALGYAVVRPMDKLHNIFVEATWLK